MICINCGGKVKRSGILSLTHVIALDNVECKEPRI